MGTRRRAGAGGAWLLSPLSGSGSAAPRRPVLDGPARRPGRGASGAKAKAVLRAAPALDERSADPAPGYRRQGPPPAGLGGAGAPALPELPRHGDPDRSRRDARPAAPGRS